MDLLINKMAVLLEGHEQTYKEITAQCTLCHREKAKVQACPLQMTEIPECPVNHTYIVRM